MLLATCLKHLSAQDWRGSDSDPAGSRSLRKPSLGRTDGTGSCRAPWGHGDRLFLGESFAKLGLHPRESAGNLVPLEIGLGTMQM